MKEPKYLFNGLYGDGVGYVRAWKEGRGRAAEIVVQVWLDKLFPDGTPDGDWSMPAVLGATTAMAQAVAQTEPPTPIKKKKAKS